MATAEKPADYDLLLDRITDGKPLDPTTYQRIRERQELITAELRERCGTLDIAVSLVREVRDET